MQQATSPQTLSPKKTNIFVCNTRMQNSTSIMSWKANVTSESVYNPTFTFMVPPSSCSSESQFYLDTNLSFTPGDEDRLLIDNSMAQRDIDHHLLPQYTYQMSYPSSSSSTTTTVKPRHNSTESLSRDEEDEEDEEDELKVRSRSKDYSAMSSKREMKREKILEKNRQAASRCRQRKKEWLSQLQTNVDRLTRENRILEEQSMSLREEILNLKTILLSHRDCSQSSKPNAIDISKIVYKNQ